MFSQLHLPLLLSIVSLARANTEKAIFLGPPPVSIPPTSPSLSDLHIDILTPNASQNNWSLRSHYIDVIFPTEEAPRGKESWYLLDELTEGTRYEVRVCWLATQPTAFHLETYPLSTVFEAPELITSLYNYSMARQSLSSCAPSRPPSTEHEASILFLRVSAAAEYFTTNATLMSRPEPILTDLILDPFLFNILPRTLVPTVGFVVLVALVSWVLGTRVVRPWLTNLVVHEDGNAKTKKTQ